MVKIAIFAHFSRRWLYVNNRAHTWALLDAWDIHTTVETAIDHPELNLGCTLVIIYQVLQFFDIITQLLFIAPIIFNHEWKLFLLFFQTIYFLISWWFCCRDHNLGCNRFWNLFLWKWRLFLYFIIVPIPKHFYMFFLENCWFGMSISENFFLLRVEELIRVYLYLFNRLVHFLLNLCLKSFFHIWDLFRLLWSAP